MIGVVLSGCDLVDQIIKPAVDKHLAAANSESAQQMRAVQEGNAKDIQAFRNENDVIRAENAELRQKVASLDFFQRLTAQSVANVDKQAATVTDSGDYGMAKTTHGPVVISLEKIQPYLDGYKATLSVGNLTAATMNGGEFEVEWGLPYSKDIPYERLVASKKTKIFSSVADFPSGSYTAVDVLLTPAQPTEVKILYVTPKWNRLTLRKPTTRVSQ